MGMHFNWLLLPSGYKSLVSCVVYESSQYIFSVHAEEGRQLILNL